MCLMCEEEAFFRAYWEQVQSLKARDAQPAQAPAHASRFTATADGEGNAAPEQHPPATESTSGKAG